MEKAFTIACVVVMALSATGQTADPRVKEVPADLGFWTPSIADSCPYFPWPWPSADDLRARAPKDLDAAEQAKEEAEHWLTLLTNERYVPNDVKDRMVLLDGNIDYIAARYVVDHLAICWVQQKSTLNILVRRVGAEKVTDIAGVGKLVEEVAQQLFIKPDGLLPSLTVPTEFIRDKREAPRAKVKEGFRVEVATGEMTLYTRPQDRSIYFRPDKSLPVAFRWGLHVNTDGQTMHFEHIPKSLTLRGGEAETRDLAPGERPIENWFSHDPEPRTIPATATRASQGQ